MRVFKVMYTLSPSNAFSRTNPCFVYNEMAFSLSLETYRAISSDESHCCLTYRTTVVSKLLAIPLRRYWRQVAKFAMVGLQLVSSSGDDIMATSQNPTTDPDRESSAVNMMCCNCDGSWGQSEKLCSFHRCGSLDMVAAFWILDRKASWSQISLNRSASDTCLSRHNLFTFDKAM